MNTHMQTCLLTSVVLLAGLSAAPASEAPPPVPRFSVENMDKSVDPGADFFKYAAGTWLKRNPIPADKSRWSGFEQLRERNLYLLRGILEETATDRQAAARTPRRQVGDFFASGLDTNRLEKLRFRPLAQDLKRIDRLKSATELVALLADFHEQDVNALFGAGVSPDARRSSIYAFELGQGGLGLPDRDYYLKDTFAKQRDAYRAHVAKMLLLLGEKPADADAHGATVLELETALARVSRTRVELRDPNKNYNKVTTEELIAKHPATAWRAYLDGVGLAKLPYVIVGQPEFFSAVDGLLKDRPLADWKVYLRWHLLRNSAPFLHAEVDQEQFAFYGKTLRGQEQQEPRWQRVAKVIDGSIGEALGRLYVEKYFPPTAKQRMEELIGNLRAVFEDRLRKVDWMSDDTRAKALTKFSRFSQKIGYPVKFRDYATVEIRRDDYLGNVRRAARFESRRQTARVGGPVDKTEWHMTPQTVNAYFNPLQNEIVFPAGILQPPFFDLDADDAVNYGGIGYVIGHEITHGYDDEGRQFDPDGNLKDWWTEKDAKEFEARAKKLVEQYNGYEVLPGVKVNGELTLGENIADLGGVSIAYEALQRLLARDPAKRKPLDGLTPEQRFFLSVAQACRSQARDAEAKRLVTIDPHSPGQFRAIGPHVNLAEFYDAFGIKEGAPMWRPVEARAKIW
jgi:putative endopeptidase